MNEKILVTGGAGYIGSHVVKALGEQGYDVLSYDNLVTGKPDNVLYGKLVEGDLLDTRKLEEVMSSFHPHAVIHFAASSVVPDSVVDPLSYYVNNVQGTLSLLSAMKACGADKIVFSSTAAVYGEGKGNPVSEEYPLQPVNPYGESKKMVEQVLRDLALSGDISYTSLRYFNVAGADNGGMIGETRENASHLITLCVRAAAGINPFLSIYGTDYPTRDGTCIRDYIHVEDLAAAHILALEHLLQGGESDVFNCGYGKGYSVLEVVEMARKVTVVDFVVRYEERRAGDPPALVADASKIRKSLGWKPRYDIVDIISSAWKWEQKRLNKC